MNAVYVDHSPEAIAKTSSFEDHFECEECSDNTVFQGSYISSYVRKSPVIMLGFFTSEVH